MDENMFNLGLDVATISTELPDPVITLSGADSYTVQDTADYPLLALSLYGKSTQDGTPTPETPIDIVSVGDDGDVEITVDNDNGIALSAIVTSGLPLCSVGDYRDELIYNADGTGKIIKRIRKVVFDGSEKWNQTSTTNEKYRMTLNIGGYESLYGDNYANTTISLVVSDQYNAISYKQASEEKNGIALLHTTGKHLSIYDENYATATIDEWKAHLAQNPLTVIYVLNTPQEIELSAAEMAELQKLQSYDGVTNILNDEQAEMLVKMLRREFDMKYIEWLKESQTWVCPKAGKWKVICVGGGASGNFTISPSLRPVLTGNGGTTSFGSIISASGGIVSDLDGLTASLETVFGQDGYNGISIGGSGACSGGSSPYVTLTGTGTASIQGHGYGASGGTINQRLRYTKGDSTSDVDACPFTTPCGCIESTIVDLEEGQSIVCTVGKGGVPFVTDEKLLEAIAAVIEGATSLAESTSAATLLANVASGKDGVIVVQYLGY